MGGAASSLRWLAFGLSRCRSARAAGAWARAWAGAHCGVARLHLAALGWWPHAALGARGGSAAGQPLLLAPRAWAAAQAEAWGVLWELELNHRLETALERVVGRDATTSLTLTLPHVDTSSARRAWWAGWGGAVASRLGLGLGAAPASMMGAGGGSAVPVVKELVLIGGGHSHAFVIKNLGMRAERGVRVTLVTQQVDTPYSGMLPGHVSGKYSRAECHIDLVRLCRFGSVRLVVGTVVGLDLAGKTVLLAGREASPLRYDVLSIDVGCQPSPVPRDPGSRNALAPMPVKPISGFSARWEELVETIRARVSARVGGDAAGADSGPAAVAVAHGEVGSRSRLGSNSSSNSGSGSRLTVAVVGAGAGGVELALSMQERLAREAPQCVPRFVLVSNYATVCPSHNASVQQRFQRLLAERGVEVLYGFEAVGVCDGVLVAEDGRTLRADEAVWCTSARAQAWLGAAGLSVDAHGFVRVKATLESESHAGVFAAGDCAHVVPHPRAKAGVFAVRQGPPLAENLRRVLRQQLGTAGAREGPLDFEPQRVFLGIIGTGRDYCVASRGEMALEGEWLWHLKDWIDRKWMASYSSQLPVQALNEEARGAATKAASALDELTRRSRMRCGGCGAKVGRSALDRALAGLDAPSRSEVAIGLDAPDDCAVVRFDGGAPVAQSVDFFRSFLDDPFTFGQVAAMHALSDCHAMGAEPVAAMAIAVLPFAAEEVVSGDLRQMMAGACDVLRKERCALVGGHSCEGLELAMGLSVSGTLRAEPLTKGGMRPGDVVVLTKPVGTGVIFAANMRVLAKGAWVESALASMLVSNREAAALAREHGAHAVTDVTGFGLAGHLLEMARASPGTQLKLDLDAVPLLDGALDLVAAGVLSSLQPDNLRLGHAVQLARRGNAQHADKGMHALRAAQQRDARFALAFDPQTSGGLLVALPEHSAMLFLRALRDHGMRHAALVARVVQADTEDAQRPTIIAA